MATYTNNTTWKTIHIFGFGQTQLFTKDLSKTFANSDLINLQEVIDNILSLKPDNIPLSNFHIIHFIKDRQIMYTSKEDPKFSFTIKYPEINSSKIDALAQEIIDRPINQEESTTIQEVQ